ncbi:MAG: hypothetical protein ABI262_19790 [Microcoleus sp.]
MTQPNILELAKQGDAKAIALLLNRQIQSKGITAAASLKDGCLQVMLEATEAPSQQALAGWVSKSIAGLGAPSIEKVKVYGRQTGAKVPAWSQEFEVAGQKLPVTHVTEGRASYSENTESNQLSLKERAKLGDVEAIASLLNLPLQNKGISATASLQDGCLQVMLEGDRVPDEEAAVRIVRRELTNLKAIASVKVYGQQAGEDFPAWNREFELKAEASTDSKKLSTDKFANLTELLTPIIDLLRERKFKELLDIGQNYLNENPDRQKRLIVVGVIVLATLTFKGIPFFSFNHNIKGSLTLKDDFFGEVGQFCDGRGGYGDIKSGRQVLVKDHKGETIATGELGIGKIISDNHCQFALEVNGIRKAEFYTIQIGRRGDLTYSYQEMEDKNWELNVSLGD